MRALIQRVSRASVSVAGEEVSSIGPGLLILLGVGKGDGPDQAAFLARKAAALRIFADQAGKLNLSAKDLAYPALTVSQFTLYADTRRGNRPGFEPAAPPDIAEELYQLFVENLRDQGLRVETGVFQAEMQVSLINDGPVTIMLEA